MNGDGYLGFSRGEGALTTIANTWDYVVFAKGLFGDPSSAYSCFATKLAYHSASIMADHENGDYHSRYSVAPTTYRKQLNKAVVQARVNI